MGSRRASWLLAALVAAVLFLFAPSAQAAVVPEGQKRKEGAVSAPQTVAGETETGRRAPPAIPLTLYQKRWIEDNSRFKIGKFTRQGGKSFGTSLEAVFDCYEHKTKWVFLSAGERQSKELMLAAATHARAIGLAVIEIEGTFKEGDTEYKQLEILFPNGSRIVGLPANPDTARGHSANVLLDEFAFHRDSRQIWRALFATVTRGYKVRVISTPQGKKNKFYEIWSGPTLQLFDGEQFTHVGDKGGWSKHNINIEQAVAMGLTLVNAENEPCAPEELRLALGDDEAWEQEYMVAFLDETTAWLPYDLISGVEDQRLVAMPAWAVQLIDEAIEDHRAHKSDESPPPFRPQAMENLSFLGELYLGMDVGRRRDLSVIWLDARREDKINVTQAAIALKKQPYGVQRRVLHALLAHPQMRRGCIDCTGLGNQLAEEAVEAFGSHKVEPITFTPASKEALATIIKRNFEDKLDRVPVDHEIRESFHSVKKISTASGNFRFDAERSETTGHADHFWAKALASEAGSTSGPAPACVGSEPDFEEGQGVGLMRRMSRRLFGRRFDEAI